MIVELYDGRDGRRRKRDVPIPLDEELVLSTWVSAGGPREYCGVWQHTVWRRTGPLEYEFLGHAPGLRGAKKDQLGLPSFATVPWRR